MTILLKKKHTLQIDDFYFKCCVGKNGITKKKIEGDQKTPKGIFKIKELYFRGDKIQKPKTNLNSIKIQKNIVSGQLFLNFSFL